MLSSIRLLFLGTIAGSICLGCGKSKRNVGDNVDRPGEPRVSYVADNDPKMTAAIHQAQGSVEKFIAELKRPKLTQSMFAVKIPIKESDHTEHMWATSVKFSDGKFSGVIDNEPDIVKTVKLGQTISAAKNEISDWMYVDGGKLVGGYTLRVLRDTLSDNERVGFDKSLPFVIE